MVVRLQVDPAYKRYELKGSLEYTSNRLQRPFNRRAVSDNSPAPPNRRQQRLATALSTMTGGDDVMSGASWTRGNAENDEIKIRGKGDKTTVIAQNFAIGTSISDIAQVMAPEPEQCLLEKRLVSASPTVIAELVFGDREQAVAVVQRFNNKRVII
jgi:hypothetical protein